MEDIEEIDLKEIISFFWNKILIIIALMVVGAIAGFVYTKYIVVPKYSSSVTLILSKPVNSEDGTVSNDSITQADITLNQKLISTYSEIMKSKKVANQVIDNLGLDVKYEDFIKGINTSFVKDSDIIKVSVATSDPIVSSNAANELVNVFSGEAERIYKIQNISIIDAGEPSFEPTNVNMVKNIAIFAIAFMALGCVIVFLIFYFDTTIKSKEEIEKSLNVPVLAIIPNIEIKKEVSKNGKRE